MFRSTSSPFAEDPDEDPETLKRQPAGERPLLLIAHERLEALRSLTQRLKPLYRLALASDPRQVLSRAQALKPSLVLLNARMSGPDGFVLCELLKTDPQTRDIPVIFVSSHSSPADRIRGLNLGAVDFISKPFDAGEVLARIRVHLRLAGQIRRGAGAAAEATGEPAALDTGAVLAQGAASFIRQHLGEELTVSQIAQQVGTHEKRLLALFSEHLGQTVSGFMRGERLGTGRRLLIETEMPVQDIARLVGYANPGNFATAFRDRNGLSPQAYRQAHRQGRRNLP